MRPLPYPEAGSGIETLRGYVNCDDAGFMLIVGWLVAAMRPSGPYPILVVNGRQGTGKTFLCGLLRSITDPVIAPLRAAPKDVRDLLVSTTNSQVQAFDNFSQIPAWLSDLFCSISTGAGFSTRELHSDKEETVFQAMCPMLINGIGWLGERGDFFERTMVVNCNEISETARRTEEDMRTALERDRPLIFGALLGALSAGLRNQAHVELPRKPRMADFAKWVTACESGLGWEPMSFLDAYMENQKDAGEAAFEADAVAVAVKKFIAGHVGGAWTGTASELLPLLGEFASESVKRSKAWPFTAQGLGNRIERAAPGLKAHGVSVTKKHSGVRLITIAIIDAPPALESADPSSF